MLVSMWKLLSSGFLCQNAKAAELANIGQQLEAVSNTDIVSADQVMVSNGTPNSTKRVSQLVSTLEKHRRSNIINYEPAPHQPPHRCRGGAFHWSERFSHDVCPTLLRSIYKCHNWKQAHKNAIWIRGRGKIPGEWKLQKSEATHKHKYNNPHFKNASGKMTQENWIAKNGHKSKQELRYSDKDMHVLRLAAVRDIIDVAYQRSKKKKNFFKSPSKLNKQLKLRADIPEYLQPVVREAGATKNTGAAAKRKLRPEEDMVNPMQRNIKKLRSDEAKEIIAA